MALRLKKLSISLVAVLIGAGGVAAGLGAYRQARHRIIGEVALGAARSAVAFDARELAMLTATRADVSGPLYGRVHARLDRFLQADPRVRSVRLVRYEKERNRLVLLAAAVRQDSRDDPQPGDIYDSLAASTALQRVLASGLPEADGPFEAEDTAWMRGFAAIENTTADDDGPPTVLMLGFLPGEWRRELWLAAGVGAFSVWLLIGLPFAVSVSWRRQREQREVIRNLSEAMEQAHSALMIIDLEHRIEYANAGLCRQSGYTRRELIGRSWRELQEPDTSPDLMADLVTTVRAGRPWRGEWTNRRKDGSAYPVRGIISPVFRRNGRLACMVVVFEDTTEFKRTEAVLRDAKERAEAGDRAKGLFLATMSHEVRTPLNGIVGFAGLLLETPLTPEQREYTETIRGSSEALIQLTGDILDYARVESGRLKLEPQLCDPRDCIEDAFDLLAAKAAEKKIELLHWVDDDVPSVIFADGGRLRQVLVNLVNNGIKFTGSGEVEVCARVVTGPEADAISGPADMPASGASAVLAFSVRDTGIGIAPDQHARLFRPFSQIDDSTTRRYGGSGLGLAICRNIVELMGGTIAVASEVNRGSVFTVLVRVPVPGGESAAPPLASLAGVRLAVAAAAPGLRGELARLGARAGASVLETDPVNLTRGPAWDLAVVDLNEKLAAEFVVRPPSAASLPPARTIALVPISLSMAHRTALRDRFRLLVNKPAHHDALLTLLATPIGADVPKAEPEAAGFGLNVLIVEDNAVNQRLAQKVVGNLGCRSATAPNGRIALDELRRFAHDFVLMDLHMPEMDGVTAIEEIRRGTAGEDRRDVWIVALTADAREEQKDRVRAAGANDYLTKPIRVPELTAALQRFVAERRAT